MEQYKSDPNVEPVVVKVKTPEQRSAETTDSRIKNLESYVNSLQGEILKLNREILRLKDDINSITTTLRRG